MRLSGSDGWLQVGPDHLVQSEPKPFPPVGHHGHATLGLLQPELVLGEGLGGNVQQVLLRGAPDDVGIHHAGKTFHTQRSKIHAGVDLGVRGLLVEGLGPLVLQVLLVPVLGHVDVHGDPLVHLCNGGRELFHLVKVQDEAGNSVEDWGSYGGWTNTIGNFIHGEGYWIKVNANDTLNVLSTYANSGIPAFTKSMKATHFLTAFPGNGVHHMNINLVKLPAAQLQEGDEIAVFDGDLCVGAVKLILRNISDSLVSIPVSASDGLSLSGFSEGNTFSLKLWKASTGFEHQVKFDETGEITCHSWNRDPEYADFRINLSDVIQLFCLKEISRKCRLMPKMKWNANHPQNDEWLSECAAVVWAQVF